MSDDKTRYEVAATLIVVQVPGATGGEAYFRRGDLVPASTTKRETERLLTLGLIQEAEVVWDEPVSEAEAAAAAAAVAVAGAEAAAAQAAAAEAAAKQAAADEAAAAREAASAAKSAAAAKPKS